MAQFEMIISHVFMPSWMLLHVWRCLLRQIFGPCVVPFTVEKQLVLRLAIQSTLHELDYDIYSVFIKQVSTTCFKTSIALGYFECYRYKLEHQVVILLSCYQTAVCKGCRTFMISPFQAHLVYKGGMILHS